MSGGVDSSAAAAILKEQGHDLVGFTMQLWDQRRGINVDENGDPLPSRCCSLDDVYDARRVAEELGFPFYVLNLEKDFERDVVQPFVDSYLSGETPIPCVSCNSRLKFASLDRLAASLGCDKVATGHYARVEYDEACESLPAFPWPQSQKGPVILSLGADAGAIVARACFPWAKCRSLKCARWRGQARLAVAEKSESQEICFVPDGNYAGFIDRYLEAKVPTDRLPARVRLSAPSGEVMGHTTAFIVTPLGQRRGIGIAR